MNVQRLYLLYEISPIITLSCISYSHNTFIIPFNIKLTFYSHTYSLNTFYSSHTHRFLFGNVCEVLARSSPDYMLSKDFSYDVCVLWERVWNSYFDFLHNLVFLLIIRLWKLVDFDLVLQDFSHNLEKHKIVTQAFRGPPRASD